MNNSFTLSFTSLVTLIALELIPSFALAANEGMPSMPLIQPTRTTVISAQDDPQSQQGFGDKEPEVKMMNLMMVEGSGMQGMDMSSNQTMAENEKMPAQDGAKSAMVASEKSSANYAVELKSSSKAKVGVNLVEFSVADVKTKRNAKGLKLKAEVYMTSMDMGTDSPRVKEMSAGNYQVKAGFAMKGPWAVKLIFPDKSEKVLNFEAATSK
jgi:hypothetical protein